MIIAFSILAFLVFSCLITTYSEVCVQRELDNIREEPKKEDIWNKIGKV